jgi:inorganic pyrophosphatase
MTGVWPASCIPTGVRPAIILLAISVAVAGIGADRQAARPPDELPAVAVAKLSESLRKATPLPNSIWRDTPPVNADKSVNAYVEIARGDRRKWEFDIGLNRRAIDRMMPARIGGYAVNYGFVPQTISYDGDPFDVLVLGPALPGGRLTSGQIVGLMLMEDEKGWDAKVVISRTAADGRLLHSLTAPEQERIAGYFRRYKENQPGMFSKVPGWGSADDGRDYVTTTHAFFKECRRASGPCRLPR